MKKISKPFIIWLIGLIAVLGLSYFLFIRNSGYIFYWDLSGAFDFRAPFDQYLFFFTPYDKLNPGIKNRLPLVTIFYLIYQFLNLFGSVPQEVVIKIALTFLFVGAYTVFYILFPKWLEIFNEKQAPKLSKDTKFHIIRLLFSLIYLFLPF